jgi:hypothetical protein
MPKGSRGAKRPRNPRLPQIDFSIEEARLSDQ